MSNITTYQNKLVEHNFFATIGDYDTRNQTPDNASRIPFTPVSSNDILRTANDDFDHIMVKGMPLSVSPCLFPTKREKFRNGLGVEESINYFYALDIIAITEVPNQTLTEEERKTQFNDAKLYINRWNAVNYLNVTEFETSANPKNHITLFGTTMATGEYGELIFNKTSYSLDNIDEYKEIAFFNNLVSVGRIGNKYYLITNSYPTPSP